MASPQPWAMIESTIAKGRADGGNRKIGIYKITNKNRQFTKGRSKNY